MYITVFQGEKLKSEFHFYLKRKLVCYTIQKLRKTHKFKCFCVVVQFLAVKNAHNRNTSTKLYFFRKSTNDLRKRNDSEIETFLAKNIFSERTENKTNKIVSLCQKWHTPTGVPLLCSEQSLVENLAHHKKKTLIPRSHIEQLI